MAPAPRPQAAATSQRVGWLDGIKALAILWIAYFHCYEAYISKRLPSPLGYSRKLLLEKWMRDAKINDIFEGTQQINLMIVARRILEYSSKELN